MGFHHFNSYPFRTMGASNTTSPAHTPGPWILVNEGSTYPGIDAEGQNIILNSDLGEYCGVRGESRDESIANARLIAAAPVLLRLVEDLYQLFADTAGEEEPTEVELEIETRMNTVLDEIYGR